MKRTLSYVLPLTLLPMLAVTTPLPRQFACTLSAWASSVRSFGHDGSDGFDGQTGRAGTPGPNQTIRAEGQPRQLYLVGGDGDNGRDGGRGDRAQNCRSQPRNVRHDLQAADGGEGGDGGDGGVGGNGGNTTIYYSTRADLRQIYVDARGGRGGLGGRGGEGGEGCRCRYRDWEVETCSNGTCTTERFFCEDGEDGYYGRSGDPGRDGQAGAVSLINQTDSLLPETPSQTQSLDVFLQRPVDLSRNLWEQRSGVLALLAPGSIVADTYREYVGRVEGQVQIQWEAARAPNAFVGLAPTASIQADGRTQVNFPEQLWVAGDYQQVDAVTTFVVTGAVRADDATRLAWGTIRGRSTDFVAAVIDRAGESEYLNTTFHLTYRTANGDPRDDRRLRYTTRYEGTLPADLVTRDNDRFELALGRLPVSGRHLQGGTYVQMELTIQRSLGSNSATQTLTWQGQL